MLSISEGGFPITFAICANRQVRSRWLSPSVEPRAGRLPSDSLLCAPLLSFCVSTPLRLASRSERTRRIEALAVLEESPDRFGQLARRGAARLALVAHPLLLLANPVADRQAGAAPRSRTHRGLLRQRPAQVRTSFTADSAVPRAAPRAALARGQTRVAADTETPSFAATNRAIRVCTGIDRFSEEIYMPRNPRDDASDRWHHLMNSGVSKRTWRLSRDSGHNRHLPRCWPNPSGRRGLPDGISDVCYDMRINT